MSRFRDPVNGFLHLGALLLSLVGSFALFWACRGDSLRMLTVGIYGVGMASCFLASTLHHLIRGNRTTELRLLWLDHAAIFPFIAGTYTPICMHLMPPLPGQIILGLVWMMALAGMVYKLGFAKAPERVEDPPELASILIYVAMGWLIIWQIQAIVTRSTGGTYWLALIGGLVYSLGGIILGRRLFDFRPGRFGHHEIWHLCVIVGAACFYLFIFLNIH